MLARSLKPVATRALSRPCIHRACFSAATIRYKAKSKPKPVRRSSARGPVANNFLSEYCFPPTPIIHSAKLSGLLSLDTEDALDLLRRYISLAKSSKQNWEKEVCIAPNTGPNELCILAHILLRSPGEGQNKLGNHILYTASKLGYARATIEIVTAAVFRKALHEPATAGPLSQLERLVQSGTNSMALHLQGVIFESKNQFDLALKMYQKASNMEANPMLPDSIEGVVKGLNSQGLIFLRKNDRESAETAFRRAALEFDDPYAYWKLGKIQEKGSSNQEVYLIKAAASGILEACHDLGLMYHDRYKRDVGIGSDGSKSKEALQWAKEWLEVSSSAGFRESTQYLNLMD